MGMQTVQVGNQVQPSSMVPGGPPNPSNLIPNQVSGIQTRPVMQQNSSLLFPLQMGPNGQRLSMPSNMMPMGNIVFTQPGNHSMNNQYQQQTHFMNN